MFCARPKIDLYLVPCQNFCADTKTEFTKRKSSFVRDKKFGTGAICKSVFGMAQKNWTRPKCFGTCKRTRHKWKDHKKDWF